MLGGGGREGSLKGALSPPPLETWRAVPFRPRAALGHTSTPTSLSQECRAGEAHAGRETAGRAGRKGRGHLTAHLPDQTGLSSAGKKEPCRRGGRGEKERNTPLSPRPLQPPAVSDLASQLRGPRLRDPRPGTLGRVSNESTPSKGGKTQTGEGEHASFWDTQEGT